MSYSMAYTIQYAPPVRRQMSRLPKAVQIRVDAAIMALAGNPRPHGSVKLSGHDDLYRVRAGDYRIIYAIQDGHRLVIIVVVAHRREVYRGF